LKNSKLQAIITLDEDECTEEENRDYFYEIYCSMRTLFSINFETVKICDQCDNGVFYFTKDKLLKDAQICGKCKGKGYY